MGIEPTTSAWKAGVIPFNYARKNNNIKHLRSEKSGRDDAIRTRDILLPKQTLYQAELHPERENYYTTIVDL